jgi:hypothetical protein
MINSIKVYINNHEEQIDNILEDIECVVSGIICSGVIWMIGRAAYNIWGL